MTLNVYLLRPFQWSGKKKSEIKAEALTEGHWMTGMLSNNDTQKTGLKNPFLVHAINNYRNNVGFESKTHFCVNQSTLNNESNGHKCTTKKTPQNTLPI